MYVVNERSLVRIPLKSQKFANFSYCVLCSFCDAATSITLVRSLQGVLQSSRLAEKGSAGHLRYPRVSGHTPCAMPN